MIVCMREGFQPQLQVWRMIIMLFYVFEDLGITAYKVQQENNFHQWDPFMLRWHISLSGCNGNNTLTRVFVISCSG